MVRQTRPNDRDHVGQGERGPPGTPGQPAAPGAPAASELRFEPGMHAWRPRWLPLLFGAALGITESQFMAAADDFFLSSWKEICIGGVGGLVAAQAGLVAIWSALGPGRHARRLWAAGAATLAWLACFTFGVGFSLVTPYGFWGDMGRAFCCIPLGVLVVPAPLWALRIFAGWRLEQPGRPDSSPAERPLALRHLMLVTAVLAVSLALVRWVDSDDNWLLGASLFAAGAAVACTVSVLPAVACLLGARRLWLGLLAMLLYIAVAAAVVAAIAWYQGAFRWTTPPSRDVVIILAMGGGYFVGLTGALLLARWCGYRLRRSRRRGTRPSRAPARHRGG